MANTDYIALIRLPDPERAPGFREALAIRSRFVVSEFGSGIVAIAPMEGPGATSEHFELHKLCDAQSDLANPSTWAALREHPPRVTVKDPAAFRDRMIALGEEVRGRRGGIEGELVAFKLAATGAAQTGELPGLLAGNLAQLFREFPDGSMWLVTVSDVLLARLAFGRAQFALQLTPDIPLGSDVNLRACSELGLGGGVDFTSVMTFPLLPLSPAVLGFHAPVLPHHIVFCFGTGAELRLVAPITFAAMYRPGVLTDPEGFAQSPALEAIGPADGEALLAWWVRQINRLYSHATDPTRFTDSDGYHDAPAQMAWMISFERLVGDALSLLAEPQASDLHRVQTAFDLLDKAESLLGYGKRDSGKGFEALLRRPRTLRRLREAYASLPPDVGTRIGDEAERLFNRLYLQVRDNTLDFRLRAHGANVATRTADATRAIDDETLVATLARAVRNSSHGLLELLHEGEDRFLLAANTGGVPAELPALAPLIALGLLADANGLIDGSWRQKLAARPVATQ